MITNEYIKRVNVVAIIEPASINKPGCTHCTCNKYKSPKTITIA